jgi:hypothetical protein
MLPPHPPKKAPKTFQLEVLVENNIKREGGGEEDEERKIEWFVQFSLSSKLRSKLKLKCQNHIIRVLLPQMSVHQSHSMLHVVLATAAISLMTLEPFFC